MSTDFKLIFLIFFSLNCLADQSFELMGGGLTYHLMTSSDIAQHFSNKLSPDGRLIDNPLIGINYTMRDKDFFTSFIFFTGQNSFNEAMNGVVIELGDEVDNFQIGWALGFYGENIPDWGAIGSAPFYFAEIGNTGFVPVFGVALNYKIPFNKVTFLKVSNVISPILINSSLSFGWNF